MKLAKWYKSTFIIAGILPIITAIVASLLYDSIKGISILSTFKSAITFICNWTLVLINFEVKVYWVLIFIFAVVIIIYIIGRWSIPSTDPEFLNFKEAKPKKLKWSWEYELDKVSNNYKLVNLQAHCDSCDTLLVFTFSVYETYLGADCPRCERNYKANQIDDKNSIQRIIDDDIRRLCK